MKKRANTKFMALSALFGALLCLCSWISIPAGAVSFTLQTFAVALALLTLGGKWGSCAVMVYLALGAVGLPVFSGFRGGIGTLLGPTGGYLFGFMLTSLLYWLVSAVLPGKVGRLLGLILGQAGCLVLGWLWLRQFTAVAFFPATLPFLLPDIFKLALAWLISRRLRRSFPS